MPNTEKEEKRGGVLAGRQVPVLHLSLPINGGHSSSNKKGITAKTKKSGGNTGRRGGPKKKYHILK